jgi:hypothetical protein
MIGIRRPKAKRSKTQELKAGLKSDFDPLQGSIAMSTASHDGHDALVTLPASSFV